MQQANSQHQSRRTSTAAQQQSSILYYVQHCYQVIFTDASTTPDNSPPIRKRAGLGIFIINAQVHPIQKVFIQGAMDNSASVLMAEAAALALACSTFNMIQYV
jgi:hypothetical protein